MSDPTPIARGRITNPHASDLTVALTDLAFAVSDYETAWRRYVNNHGGDDQLKCELAMASAHDRQRDARTRVASLILSDALVTLPYALEAVLVLASARADGERPDLHRRHLVHSALGAAFVDEKVKNGGIA